jgi:hypothetical protein
MPLRQRHPHQTRQSQRLQVKRVNIVVGLLIRGRCCGFYSRAAIVLAYMLAKDRDLHTRRVTALDLSAVSLVRCRGLCTLDVHVACGQFIIT